MDEKKRIFNCHMLAIETDLDSQRQEEKTNEKFDAERRERDCVSFVPEKAKTCLASATRHLKLELAI